MNRLFGKAKEKAPPPDMSAVIKGVNECYGLCIQ